MIRVSLSRDETLWTGGAFDNAISINRMKEDNYWAPWQTPEINTGGRVIAGNTAWTTA